MRRLFHFFRVAPLMALLASHLPAQDGSPFDPEGRPVAEILLESDGPFTRVSEEDCRKLIELEEGRPFSSSKVKYSIEQLHATRAFYDIQVITAPASGGTVEVTFLLYRRYLIRHIGLRGDLGMEKSRVRRELPLRVGQPYSRRRIEEAVSHLEVFYQRHGYYRALIEPGFKVDVEKASIDLEMRVEAGLKARLASAEFTAAGEGAEGLRRELQLRPGQAYSKAALEAHIEELRKRKKLEGYLDLELNIVLENYFPERNQVELLLDYTTGQKTTLEFQGVELDREELLSLPIFDFSSASEILARQTASRLEELHQRKGYFRARADFNALADGGLVFTVEAGPKAKLVSVSVRGTEPIPPQRVRRLLRTKEAGIFGRGEYSGRLVEQDEETIVNLFRSEGFQQASVEHDLRPAPGRGENELELVYLVRPGPRSTVADVGWSGNEAVADAEIESLISSRAGQPFSPFQAARDRSEILTYYEDLGYRQADVTIQASTLGGDQGGVSLYFDILEGEQTFIDEVVVTGDLDTRPGVIRRQLRLQPGEPYSLGRALQTETNLHDLAVFARVQVDAVQVSDKPDARTVVIQLEEAPKYTLLYGFGFSSFEGPRGTLGISNSNFLGRAQVASASIRASETRQRGSLSWNVPHVWGLDLPTVFSFIVRNEELRTSRDGDVETIEGRPFEEFRLTASAEAERILSRRESLFFGLRFEDVDITLPPDLTEASLNFFRESQDLELATLDLRYVNESRDVPSDPNEGFFLSGNASFSTRALGSQEEFFRFLATGHYFYPLPRGMVLASSLRIGWILPYGKTSSPDESNPVPVSERFFSGGSTTLRGLPQDLAGPLLRDDGGEVILVDNEGRLDPGGLPVAEGGNALFISNIELRSPLYKRLSGVLFYDTGNLFRDFGEFALGDFSNALGVGLRVRTPVGPFRVDAAYNPNPRDVRGFDRWIFHISLGHAF